MKMQGARVIVTGGSAGIGRETARMMVARGARVVVTGRREHTLREAAAAIGAHPIAGDVSVEADCIRTVRDAAAHLGGLDVLVNNAGFGYRTELVAIETERFNEVWGTNVLGAALMAREAARLFVAQKSGNIVNVASTAGTKGYAGGTAYAATKWALRGMTECWQAELRPHNVRVISVCPSEVQTEFGGRKRDRLDAKKLVSEDIAHMIVAALEMDDRGFVPEFRVFATNPW